MSLFSLLFNLLSCYRVICFVDTFDLVNLLLLLEQRIVYLWILKKKNQWLFVYKSYVRIKSGHTIGIHLFSTWSNSNSCPSSVSKMNFWSSLKKEIRGSLSNSDGSDGKPARPSSYSSEVFTTFVLGPSRAALLTGVGGDIFEINMEIRKETYTKKKWLWGSRRVRSKYPPVAVAIKHLFVNGSLDNSRLNQRTDIYRTCVLWRENSRRPPFHCSSATVEILEKAE